MSKWLEILLVLLVTVMPFILLEVGYKEGYRCARRDIEDEKIGMLKCLRCDLYKNRHLYDKKPIAIVTIPQMTEDTGGNPEEVICETCPVREVCWRDGNALCITDAGDYGLYPLPSQENVKHEI
jgi:hypothetical protein